MAEEPDYQEIRHEYCYRPQACSPLIARYCHNRHQRGDHQYQGQCESQQHGARDDVARCTNRHGVTHFPCSDISHLHIYQFLFRLRGVAVGSHFTGSTCRRLQDAHFDVFIIYAVDNSCMANLVVHAFCYLGFAPLLWRKGTKKI